jgi:hypothetical protein
VEKTLLACVLLAVASCASSPEKPSKYPPQKEGCEVQIFSDTPTMQTDNIGPVSASCDESVSDQDCLRTMKDEACKLGANVVWGVEPNPTKQLGKKKFFGRAAHTK